MYEIKIALLFLTLLFTSMNAFGNYFYQSTSKRWLSTIAVELNPELKFDEAIKEPAGTSIHIASIILQDQNFTSIKDCLIYKVPKKETTGELKVISTSIKNKCKSLVLNPSNIEIKEIYNFSISKKERSLILNVDKESFDYFLFNSRSQTGKRLGDNSSSNYKIPGLSLSFVKPSKESSIFLKPGDICHDVDNSCNEIVKNSCHLCPNSFYEVISSACPKSVRKVCGNLICGKKGFPACIRGYGATEFKGNYCMPDSPIAFCEKPARVMCVNGQLLCR